MSPARRGALAAWLALVCGCGPQAPIPGDIPGDEVALRVEIGAASAEPGRAFPVRIVRSWRKGLEPDPFRERALRPLTLVRESVTRRESATHMEETLSFRGYAFARADVTVPTSTFAARPTDGGPARVASAPGRVLAVRPAVSAAAPGEPELPDLAPARPPLWHVGLGAALLVALALLLARRRRAPTATEPARPAAPEDGERRAAALAACRAALERLGAKPAPDGDARVQRLLAVAWLVRGVLALDDPGTLARTPRELATTGRAQGDRRARVAGRLVLAPAERVLYAREAPDERRLARVVAAARAVLAESAR